MRESGYQLKEIKCQLVEEFSGIFCGSLLWSFGICGQVRDAIQTELVQAGEAGSSRSRRAPRSSGAGRGGSGAKYSRLEAEVAAMQRDSSTYCDQPQDGAQFEDWLQVAPALWRALCCAWPLVVPSAAAIHRETSSEEYFP